MTLLRAEPGLARRERRNVRPQAARRRGLVGEPWVPPRRVAWYREKTPSLSA